MSLVFPLHNVSIDEAEEVRHLLHENEILFYETDSGIFGTAIAGLWVNDEAQKEYAKTLLEEYSSSRSIRMREQFEQERLAGDAETLWQRFKARPLWFLSAMIFLAAVVFVATIPFMIL